MALRHRLLLTWMRILARRGSPVSWGSANMMAQVQCRLRIAALLPHHPMGKVWRERLAKAVTLGLEDQINESRRAIGVPAFGTMAIEMPLIGLTALANYGDVDLSRAEKRLRAAAHLRLATLLPYDVRGNLRSETPEGDGYYMDEIVFAPLAGFFQHSDPTLARNLVWGFTESGQ